MSIEPLHRSTECGILLPQRLAQPRDRGLQSFKRFCQPATQINELLIVAISHAFEAFLQSLRCRGDSFGKSLGCVRAQARGQTISRLCECCHCRLHRLTDRLARELPDLRKRLLHLAADRRSESSQDLLGFRGGSLQPRERRLRGVAGKGRIDLRLDVSDIFHRAPDHELVRDIEQDARADAPDGGGKLHGQTRHEVRDAVLDFARCEVESLEAELEPCKRS